VRLPLTGDVAWAVLYLALVGEHLVDRTVDVKVRSIWIMVLGRQALE
jgi:hypothetical protein